MKRILLTLLASATLAASPAGAKHKHPSTESGQFDYYVLSLSWAPVYCEAHPSDQAECGDKRCGFVLHGLWPQFQAGGYPQNCSTSNRLDDGARTFGGSVYPSEKLVAHEWDRHGTCSGRSRLHDRPTLAPRLARNSSSCSNDSGMPPSIPSMA